MDKVELNRRIVDEDNENIYQLVKFNGKKIRKI